MEMTHLSGYGKTLNSRFHMKKNPNYIILCIFLTILKENYFAILIVYWVKYHLWKICITFQMEVEVQSWPYDFPASKDFLPLDQRGSVSGRLLVHDR